MTSFDLALERMVASRSGFAGVRDKAGSMTEFVTRGRRPAGPIMIGVLEKSESAAALSGATNGSGCHSSTRSSISYSIRRK
jgi:hypothetical protein